MISRFDPGAPLLRAVPDRIPVSRSGVEPICATITLMVGVGSQSCPRQLFAMSDNASTREPGMPFHLVSPTIAAVYRFCSKPSRFDRGVPPLRAGLDNDLLPRCGVEPAYATNSPGVAAKSESHPLPQFDLTRNPSTWFPGMTFVPASPTIGDFSRSLSTPMPDSPIVRTSGRLTMAVCTTMRVQLYSRRHGSPWTPLITRSCVFECVIASESAVFLTRGAHADRYTFPALRLTPPSPARCAAGSNNNGRRRQYASSQCAPRTASHCGFAFTSAGPRLYRRWPYRRSTAVHAVPSQRPDHQAARHALDRTHDRKPQPKTKRDRSRPAWTQLLARLRPGGSSKGRQKEEAGWDLYANPDRDRRREPSLAKGSDVKDEDEAVQRLPSKGLSMRIPAEEYDAFVAEAATLQISRPELFSDLLHGQIRRSRYPATAALAQVIATLTSIRRSNGASPAVIAALQEQIAVLSKIVLAEML